MKTKIFCIVFLFMLTASHAGAQSTTPEELKKLAVQDLIAERFTDDEYYVEDESGVEEMRRRYNSTRMLDSALKICLDDYYTKGFCFYRYHKLANKTLVKLMEENYESLFFSEDIAKSTDRAFQYYYNICMKVLFKQLHGWNIFQKLYTQAQKIDGSGKGNRTVTFPGGYDAMLKFIYCNLNYFDIKDTTSYSPGVFATLYFNEKGTLDSLIVGDYMENEEKNWPIKYKDEVERVLRSMPPFLPATDDGKPVPGSFYMEISYYPGIRKHVKCE